MGALMCVCVSVLTMHVHACAQTYVHNYVFMSALQHAFMHVWICMYLISAKAKVTAT